MSWRLRERFLKSTFLNTRLFHESNFFGNKLIKEEALREALGDNDFVEGRVFKPNVLEQVEQELKRQYLNQGKYNAQVGTEVTDLPRNRVSVKLHVKEGPTR